MPRKCFLDALTMRGIQLTVIQLTVFLSYTKKTIFVAARFFFLLQERYVVPRKKNLAARKKINVFSLHQEIIFLAPEHTAVSEHFSPTK